MLTRSVITGGPCQRASTGVADAQCLGTRVAASLLCGKDRVVGNAPMRGGTGAAATVNVTGTDVLLAPGALTVIVPLYVPAANDPVTAVTLITPLLVPEAGESVNQAALSLAVQVSVPPPVLLIFSVWVAGLPLPRWTVKEKLVGLVPMAGARVQVLPSS